ncbi:hypothetical protein V1478_017315 [Vespula squamosa]|uniref:Uncharacterized protein n=1 Tax=Vespula squamosa TaxID=30214 RepID=A0ABD1ZY77_VESSQ
MDIEVNQNNFDTDFMIKDKETEGGGSTGTSRYTVPMEIKKKKKEEEKSRKKWQRVDVPKRIISDVENLRGWTYDVRRFELLAPARTSRLDIVGNEFSVMVILSTKYRYLFDVRDIMAIFNAIDKLISIIDNEVTPRDNIRVPIYCKSAWHKDDDKQRYGWPHSDAPKHVIEFSNFHLQCTDALVRIPFHASYPADIKSLKSATANISKVCHPSRSGKIFVCEKLRYVLRIMFYLVNNVPSIEEKNLQQNNVRFIGKVINVPVVSIRYQREYPKGRTRTKRFETHDCLLFSYNWKSDSKEVTDSSYAERRVFPGREGHRARATTAATATAPVIPHGGSIGSTSRNTSNVNTVVNISVSLMTTRYTDCSIPSYRLNTANNLEVTSYEITRTRLTSLEVTVLGCNREGPNDLVSVRKITEYDLEIGLFGKSEDIRDVYRQTQGDGRRTLVEGKLFDETRDRNGKCLVASIRKVYRRLMEGSKCAKRNPIV